MTFEEIKNLGRKRYKVFGNFYKKCLIYKITNLINSKIYIGQTTNLSKRFKSYLYHGTQTKGQQPIHRALKKYGLNQFSFEILEETTLELLNNREIFYIKEFNSYLKENGYNLTLGGVKFRWNEENKQKRRESAINKKPVYLYNKDGSFFQKFDSINNCATFLKTKHCTVLSAIKKHNILCKHYIAKFEFQDKIEPYKNLKSEKISQKLQKNRNCKTYIWRLENTKENKIFEADGIKNLSILSGFSVYILTSIAYNRPGNPEYKKFLKVTKLHDYNTNNC